MMMKPAYVRFNLLCSLLLAFAYSNAVFAESRDAHEHFFQSSFGDLREEMATARDQDKRGILIMFEVENCPWCLMMETTVLNQHHIQDYFRHHFRILKLDAEGKNMITNFSGESITEKEFALKHNRIRATPTFAFFDLSAKLVMRYTGITRTVDEFLWLGEFVIEGHYKTQKFTRYKRARRQKNQSKS